MSNLSARYSKLKKAVGGNRERTAYEESFGMPKEEFLHITMPNKHIGRILAEIEFAIRLSKENEFKFDAVISDAITFLQAKIDDEGVLTKDSCLKGESFLLPLQSAAKEYSLILAAHAHIDMNWMWGWSETVASTIATFQTMLKLMDEYPEFCFSQSQASVYKIIENYAPELMDEIKKRIKEGRWEVTASAWVETDKNMPSTESLLRHIKYTHKYMHEQWGVDPENLDIDFSPDTFGHSANVPEINTFGGLKYYYHCRALDGDYALYRWKSQSGSETLVYREQYWYNSGITPLAGIGLIDVSKRSGGLKTGLVVYGVGDHGGGPTRRDLERAIEMHEWPIFPDIRFGTIREFFKLAETVRENLPVVEHELNFIFPGCYTTQSRLKMGNRHSEAAITEAEAWSALAQHELDTSYLDCQFEDAWQNILFTHFHDILTGSCVQDSREHAMGLFSHSMSIANTRSSMALQQIAKNIDTSNIKIEEMSGTQSEGAGPGYGLDGTGVPVLEQGRGLTRIFHIFNSQPRLRTENVQFTVWDWTGDLRYMSIEDSNGQKIPFQLDDKELQQYWDHKYFRVTAQVKVPSCGYTTIVLRETEPTEYEIYMQPSERTGKPYTNYLLENEYLKAEFDWQSGELISLVDKKMNVERLRKGETGGLRYIETEASSSNAWCIGRYCSISKSDSTPKITANIGQNLVDSITIEQTIRSSKIKTVISLGKGDRAFKYDINVDWHEIGRNGSPVPVLVYHLPVIQTDNFLYDVPAGVQYRKAMNIDVPALQFGAAIYEDERAVSVITDCKYGYRGWSDGLTVTLIHSATSPDPYPERGIHNIKIFVGVECACPKVLLELATDMNSPFHHQTGVPHDGKLPVECSLLSFESETAVLSSIFSENGSLMARIYELCGKAAKAEITVKGAVAEATLVNLAGKAVANTIKTDDTMSFSVNPYSIATVKFSK